jgi:hypothetical protein
MNRLLLFKKALEECRKRLKETPNLRPLISIEKQLEYLIDLEEGRRTDTELMANLNLGIVAVRELEPHDIKLANLIYDVTEAIKTH